MLDWNEILAERDDIGEQAGRRSSSSSRHLNLNLNLVLVIGLLSLSSSHPSNWQLHTENFIIRKLSSSFQCRIKLYLRVDLFTHMNKKSVCVPVPLLHSIQPNKLVSQVHKYIHKYQFSTFGCFYAFKHCRFSPSLLPALCMYVRMHVILGINMGAVAWRSVM